VGGEQKPGGLTTVKVNYSACSGGRGMKYGQRLGRTSLVVGPAGDEGTEGHIVPNAEISFLTSTGSSSQFP